MTISISTPPPPVRRTPRLADEQGLRVALAHGALVAAAAAAAVLGLGPGAAMVLLGASAVAGSLALHPGWALLLGASAWAFWTGFLDHRLGQLTMTPSDLTHLAALTSLALAASLLSAGAGHRRWHRG